jgi:hypothetical protein
MESRTHRLRQAADTPPKRGDDLIQHVFTAATVPAAGRESSVRRGPTSARRRSRGRRHGCRLLRALCGGTSDRVPRRERPSARARPTLNHAGHDQIDPHGSCAATALPVVATHTRGRDRKPDRRRLGTPPAAPPKRDEYNGHYKCTGMSVAQRVCRVFSAADIVLMYVVTRRR